MRLILAGMAVLGALASSNVAGAKSNAPMSRVDARKACCANIGGRWVANTDGSANGTCYPAGSQAPFYQCMREKGFN